MERESIIENCQRLQVFLKDTTRYDAGKIINDVSPKGLLDLYSRILDCHGAPVTGWSWLYLTGADYVEMDNYCRANCSAYHGTHGVSFGFEYYGYKWYVINK